jgi:hypothetical protein
MIRKLQGIIGLDAVPTGQIIGSKFNTAYTTLEDFYLKRSGREDKKLVYRTAIINLYPDYPVFEGENTLELNICLSTKNTTSNAK